MRILNAPMAVLVARPAKYRRAELRWIDADVVE